MKSIKVLLGVFVALIGLSSCSGSSESGTETKIVPTEKSLTETSQETVLKGVDDIWGLNIGYDFGRELKKEFAYDRYEIKDSKTDKLDFFVEKISDFNRLSDGLADWTISQSFRDKLMVADDACAVLEDEKNNILMTKDFSVYLPIYLEKSILCESQKINDMLIISVVGTGFRYESLANISNLMLVVRENDILLIQDIVPVDLIAGVKWDLITLIDSFVKENPAFDFPDETWGKLDELVNNKIDELITAPHPELLNAMNYMKEVGATMTTL